MQQEILAIRFGYGLPAAATDPDQMLAALSGPDLAATRWPGPGQASIAAAFHDFQLARRAKDDAAKKAAQVAALALATESAKASFARAIGSEESFRERLVAFWADHFTTTARNPMNKPLTGLMVEQAIRPHVAGRFADLLRAATTHPAMLVYLNQDVSIGPGSPTGRRQNRGLNENLARELLELHTLGVGAAYSQADVRELAKLLTGLTVAPGAGMIFDPKRAEPGAETVLGVAYDGEGINPILDFLEDIAARPETARHIASKLAVHFVSDDPDTDLVETLAAAFLDSGGDLSTLAKVLLAHPAAAMTKQKKARQPQDFLVAGLRALGIGPEVIFNANGRSFGRIITTPLAAMGQPFRSARGPNGWPEAEADWITPQGLAARISWAMRVPQRLVNPLPDPRAFLQSALGGLAGKDLTWAVSAAETARDGVGIVLASPEFNRR